MTFRLPYQKSFQRVIIRQALIQFLEIRPFLFETGFRWQLAIRSNEQSDDP